MWFNIAFLKETGLTPKYTTNERANVLRHET